MARSIPEAIHSMAKSYMVAFIVISFMMIFLVKNIKIGILSMIANILPIRLTMGIMNLLNFNLDMSRIFIGSIAIGIVVDDTIHFLYNFRKYYEKTRITTSAIQETMLSTRRVLLMTSLILSVVFFVLMTASLSLIVMFGILTGITIIFCAFYCHSSVDDSCYQREMKSSELSHRFIQIKHRF